VTSAKIIGLAMGAAFLLGFVSNASASLSVVAPEALIASLQGPVLEILPPYATPRTSQTQPQRHTDGSRG
jgi:hypothetical protein